IVVPGPVAKRLAASWIDTAMQIDGDPQVPDSSSGGRWRQPEEETHMSTAKTPPLLPGASSTQTKAILGAMRAMAETGGAATKEDQVALASADQYIFGTTRHSLSQ